MNVDNCTLELSPGWRMKHICDKEFGNMRNKKLELVLAKAKGETKLLKWIRVYII